MLLLQELVQVSVVMIIMIHPNNTCLGYEPFFIRIYIFSKQSNSAYLEVLEFLPVPLVLVFHRFLGRLGCHWYRRHHRYQVHLKMVKVFLEVWLGIL